MKKGGFTFCPLCGSHLFGKQVDGRKRNVCRECGWIHYMNPAPVVVCAAMYNNGKMLITRRNLEPGLGKWALPGGFIESGETAETACLRELQEETGVKGKIKRLVGVYAQGTKYYGSLLVIGYEVTVTRALIRLNSELKEARFVGKNKLPDIPFLSHRKMIRQIWKI